MPLGPSHKVAHRARDAAVHSASCIRQRPNRTHFFFSFKIFLKSISFASGLPYCWSLHALVLSEQRARWRHRKTGLKAESLHAWRDLKGHREGHEPTTCAKNQCIEPSAWAPLGESKKLISISLCGGFGCRGRTRRASRMRKIRKPRAGTM